MLNIFQNNFISTTLKKEELETEPFYLERSPTKLAEVSDFAVGDKGVATVRVLAEV